VRKRHLVNLAVVLLCLPALGGQRPAFRQNSDRDIIPEGSRVQYKTFSSEILAREIPYGLYLPPSYEENDQDYPVVFFLHGANENEKRWSTRGRTDLMLDQMIADGEIGEFIVAIPFGENSFYTNSVSGERWEDMVTEEFMPMIEADHRALGTRAGRAISGVSMGGYGALKLAMKNPGLFGSVSAHSAMLLDDLESTMIRPDLRQLYLALFDEIFGVSESMASWDANNPLGIAREVALDGMKIYFDCGTEDQYGFFTGAEQLHDILDSRSIDHEFYLYPGRHGWDYAREHTAAALKFHWDAFNGD
jgi:S-formylglutathione hydrolase FrmB